MIRLQLHLLFCFLEEIYGAETKIISMDFTGGAEIYDGLPEKLADLDIGILGINVIYWHFFCTFATHLYACIIYSFSFNFSDHLWSIYYASEEKIFKGLRSPCCSLSLSKPIAFTVTTSKVDLSVFSFLLTHTSKFRYFSGVVKCEML